MAQVEMRKDNWRLFFYFGLTIKRKLLLSMRLIIAVLFISVFILPESGSAFQDLISTQAPEIPQTTFKLPFKFPPNEPGERSYHFNLTYFPWGSSALQTQPGSELLYSFRVTAPSKWSGFPYSCEGKLGQACAAPNEEGTALDPQKKGWQAVGGIEGIATGLARLQTLFAKVFKVFEWNSKEQVYEEVDEEKKIFDNLSLNSTENGSSLFGGYTPIPPTISKLTLNGKDKGEIIGKGQLLVRLNFYAWAASNQMPLRHLTINWGDELSLQPGPEGRYRNYKEKCDGKDFGSRSPEDCLESPLSFSHLYH